MTYKEDSSDLVNIIVYIVSAFLVILIVSLFVYFCRIRALTLKLKLKKLPGKN